MYIWNYNYDPTTKNIFTFLCLLIFTLGFSQNNTSKFSVSFHKNMET